MLKLSQVQTIPGDPRDNLKAVVSCVNATIASFLLCGSSWLFHEIFTYSLFSSLFVSIALDFFFYYPLNCLGPHIKGSMRISLSITSEVHTCTQPGPPTKIIPNAYIQRSTILVWQVHATLKTINCSSTSSP